MTKADIIESVYEKVGGFSKKEAAEIVETVFNVVKQYVDGKGATISRKYFATNSKACYRWIERN